MEYAISISITLIFILIYFFSKSKSGERFSKNLDENNFIIAVKSSILPDHLPEKTGKKEYSPTKFVKKIKFVNFLCRRSLNAKLSTCKFPFENLQYFHRSIEQNLSTLKDISKSDFSKLDDLPAIGSYLRIEKLCSTILENNNYKILPNNISTAFDFYNLNNTITFPEIQNFHLIAKYLLLEKLHFVSIRVENLIKIGHYAKRVASHPKFYEKKKFYNQVKTNNIFLHFTSTCQNLECPSADLVYFDVINNINKITDIIFDGLKFIESFDFTKFYTPLQFLEMFESFKNANIDAKENFLTELSNQSSTQNIDELAYTYSLIKYTNRAGLPRFRSKQISLLGKFLIFSSFPSNMKTLSMAIKSSMAMNLIFSNKKQKTKKI